MKCHPWRGNTKWRAGHQDPVILHVRLTVVLLGVWLIDLWLILGLHIGLLFALLLTGSFSFSHRESSSRHDRFPKDNISHVKSSLRSPVPSGRSWSVRIHRGLLVLLDSCEALGLYCVSCLPGQGLCGLCLWLVIWSPLAHHLGGRTMP